MVAIEPVLQPEGYFYELLCGALRQRQLKPHPATEFYLVNLLSQLMTSDALVSGDALAFLLKSAMEAEEPNVQRVRYQHVGDSSLTRAGLFPGMLKRSSVDVGYYIGMGTAAYEQAGVRSEQTQTRAVFLELSQRFADFVEVFGEIGDKSFPLTDQNLLKIYEEWQDTQSERAARKLREAGIVPVPTANGKKSLQ